MIKKKCRVLLTAYVTAYIQYNDKNEPVEFDELDELDDVQEFEVKSIIN